MKQITSYRFLNIPNKFRGELRIIIDSDRNPEYVNNGVNGKVTAVTLHPLITITIVKPAITDENGQRMQSPWTINDSLSLNKFNLAIFRKELKSIIKDLEISELYTYHGKRLELNEAIAEKVRRVFMVNTTAIEFSPVVIVQNDDRFEGVKIKFNNEQSSVMLTLNELTAFDSQLNDVDMDSIAILLYLNYINRPDHPKNFDTLMNSPTVDIVPKNNDFS